MNKATKGALAALAGGSLMLGGAGTLAYWTGQSTVNGATNIVAGNLTLSNPDCTTAVGSHDWQYDNGDSFTPASDTIVPGDSLSKVCDLSLVLTGSHIGATLAIDSASFASSNALTGHLSPTATFTVDTAAYAPITKPGTYAIRVTITVPFDSASTNGQTLTAALNAIAVTATQTHDTAANS